MLRSHFVCCSCCQTARSTWWRLWTPWAMLLMPCRRRTWAWRHASRPTCRGRQSGGPVSRAAPMVRETRHDSQLYSYLSDSFFVYLIFSLSLCLCIFNPYSLAVWRSATASCSTLCSPDTLRLWNYIPVWSVCHPSHHIFRQPILAWWYQDVSLGYLLSTLYSGLGRDVDFFFLSFFLFTVHEKWLACPPGRIAERERKAWGIIPLEGF